MSNGMARLIDIEKGTQVKIAAFDGESRYMTRLNQSGLYPGDLARVVRIAPFDGPILIEVRGMEIALGKSLAARILVEVAACDSL
jgi:Fe2+ transport system protein FeoA